MILAPVVFLRPPNSSWTCHRRSNDQKQKFQNCKIILSKHFALPGTPTEREGSVRLTSSLSYVIL
jgi:hypothetical protein